MSRKANGNTNIHIYIYDRALNIVRCHHSTVIQTFRKLLRVTKLKLTRYRILTNSMFSLK